METSAPAYDARCSLSKFRLGEKIELEIIDTSFAASESF